VIAFLRAHGVDPGRLQRPMLAGAISGLIAAAAAAPAFVGFGSFRAAADQVIGIGAPLTGALSAAGFVAGGVLYGLVFRRAANDAAGGWLFGLVFGFLLWMAAPVIVLPLMATQTMAAGRAAAGFLATFVIWGLVLGLVFPRVHRPLHRRMDGPNNSRRPGPAVSPQKLLRRVPDRWR
jgi:hypothetical protein